MTDRNTRARRLEAAGYIAAKADITNFRRGFFDGLECPFTSQQMKSGEVLSCGGPDFCAGEDTDEPPSYHEGWDFAVDEARRSEQVA